MKIRVFIMFKNVFKRLLQKNSEPNIVLSESLALDKRPDKISYTWSRKGQCLAQISGHFESQHVMKIDYMNVESKLQGQGIGSSLLQAYINYAANNNVQEIHVVSARTMQAISFYGKHGFDFVGKKNLLIKTLYDNPNEK